MKRQRWSAWVGVALVVIAVTRASQADDATAEATLRQAKATIRKNTHVPHQPVTHVILEGNVKRRHIRPADLKALQELKEVRYLKFAFSDLTDAGLYELTGMTSLRVLDLYNTQVTDAGMKYVNQLTGLRELTLGQDRITDAGLAELKDLKELRDLVLNKTRVTDRGMTELKRFEDLESLLLDDTQVSDAGVYELIGLPNLHNLVLNGTRVTDASLRLAPHFKSLKHLQVWHTRGVTDAGAESLRAAMPQLDVAREDSVRLRTKAAPRPPSRRPAAAAGRPKS